MPDSRQGAGWKPASTGRDEDWEAPAEAGSPDYHTGVAREVEFFRQDEPCAAVLIWVYPAWFGEDPETFEVHVTWDWIRGESPANPVGTETWSWTDSAADPSGPYATMAAAENRARYLAGLLSQGSYRDLDRIAPGLFAGAFSWDGARQPEAAAEPAAA